MKLLYRIFLLFYLLPYLPVEAQSFYRYEKDARLSVILGTGLNNYYGELNDAHTFKPNNFNLSAGVQYPLTSRINLRGELMFYKLSAADKDAPAESGRQQRNLSFRANTFDFTLTGMINLLPEYLTWKQTRNFNPYLFAGVGFTYINPEAKYEGVWYALRPQQTEGVAYKAVSPVFPVGLGLKYVLNKNVELMAECSYRFTTTDYLDDVSTIYISQEDFHDPIAAALADRGPEVDASRTEAGGMRGNPKLNDGYLTLNFKVAFKIGEQKPLRKIQETFY